MPPRQTIILRLAAATEQQLRRVIHRRGDIVRLIETTVVEGLTALSRFTPRRRRYADTEMTRTTVRLDRELVARLDAAARQLGTTRAALLEAMLEVKLQVPRSPGPRTLTCLQLDPAIAQQFRQGIHYRGDVSRVITDIIRAGLAAPDRFAHLAQVRRRPAGGPRPYQRLMISVETELFATLTQVAKRLGASRTALLEAMIAARLQGEI